MCYVSVSDFRENLSYYLLLSQKEDVHITKNNKVVAILCDPQAKAIDDFLALRGCLKKYDDGKTYKEIIGEAITEKCK